MPLAQMAAGVPQQPKVRAAAPDPLPVPMPPPMPAPMPPPLAPAKFVLPSPEALGIATTVNAPQQPTPVQIDWNQLHARMERLGVLRYQKDMMPTGGVRVTLLLPTNDPARGQPVEALAATEGEAISAALERAEAWRQGR